MMVQRSVDESIGVVSILCYSRLPNSVALGFVRKIIPSTAIFVAGLINAQLKFGYCRQQRTKPRICRLMLSLVVISHRYSVHLGS